MAQTNRINSDSMVDLIFHLRWKSEFASHTDGYQASQVNVWRDLLEPKLLDALMDKTSGDRFNLTYGDGEAIPAFSAKKLFTIQSNRFDRREGQAGVGEPRQGRFYPKGVLRGMEGIFRANVQPFRCVGLNDGHLTVDFNHPLAAKELQLSVMVGKVDFTRTQRGGTSMDWMDVLASGPGMQARWQDQPSDYFSDEAFDRTDHRPDAAFYRNPRYVHHMDAMAREVVKNTYGRFLSSGNQVLDLMSSWQSHLPEDLHLNRFVGLGLNEDELKKNACLSDYLVRDLNEDARLPFETNTFDAVINTASIEYLTDPQALFREASRILRPDGYFIITFTNRWFPTKAINIWKTLHDHERMGLVLEYFLRAGGFKELQTYSIRGLPRPHDDQYFPQQWFSDPVYAVWGRKQ